MGFAHFLFIYRRYQKDNYIEKIKREKEFYEMNHKNVNNLTILGGGAVV